MILYLLFPLLILAGIVESQMANMTADVEGNKTFSKSTNDSNVTSSLYKDEKSLQSNQTRAVITEDDESFQDQEKEFPGRHCLQDLLVQYSHSICGQDFHTEMMSISPENWCVLENIIRPYNNMTLCLEWLSGLVSCYYPNPSIQDFFISIHSEYFQNCPEEELQLVDAPHGVVIALTLIPVSLIPILVYLVVWKSNIPK